MKKLLQVIVLLCMYTNLYASIQSVRHPKSEPKGLYLITMKEIGVRSTTYREYRLYCPSMMIREITNGKKRAAHKVRDVLHLHDADFYANITTICKYKKHVVYQDGHLVTPLSHKSKNSPLTKETPNGITIVEISEDGLDAEIILSDKRESCRIILKDMNRIKVTDCTQFTNSKHIKIVCTPHKKICKTEKELFAYVDNKLSNASHAMREYQVESTKQEQVINKLETADNKLLKDGTYSWQTSYSEASLSIRKENNAFKIKGNALSGTSNKYGPNIGELAFTAFMRNRKIIYTKEDYTFTLKVNDDGSFDVTEEGSGIDFGRGVSFEGHFTSDS